ncbi:uncharacterized protein LOC116189298 [Punica granatum]|uniref:Uncharacterized protein LOC116189298 n=2 Tax=Punica granatum TaxID=22663 RepID=A0A6P8BV34_PUNGR|nr:uncharacterized protein LOC116189298 [Punica granatum]PKI45641.1 hypothetical protein CRG98_033957 [Punica granatum]
MSRCFPYTPPGYVKSGARGGEGSIGSIKLQKEKTKTDSERRKEKKQLKKEQKELLRKQTDVHHGKSKKLSDKKSLHDENMYPSACIANLSDDSSRSGLSEEHDQPVPENHFYLSDGTDSSKKRKLDAPSLTTVQSGNKIRIRFNLKRHNNPEAPLGQEPSCSTSTSAQVDPLVHRQCKTIITHVEADALVHPPCKTINTHVQEKSAPTANLKLTIGRRDVPTEHKKEESSIESLYKALLGDWSAPPISTEREDPDDQEWLFGTKRQEKSPKRLKSETLADASCPIKNGDLWPRAHYLPDVEIFALPYTVPF